MSREHPIPLHNTSAASVLPSSDISFAKRFYSGNKRKNFENH
jgi:hypothetical protein